MEEIRNRMLAIEDPRHPSYVRCALADILIIIMSGVLCGLDTLEDLVVYAKSAADFLWETFGIENIPSKATFGRVLSAVDGKEIGDAILDILRKRFGTSGEVIAVDGKAICSTVKGANSHKALQILSAYVTDSGITLAQETIHEKTNEIPVFQEMLTYWDVEGSLLANVMGTWWEFIIVLGGLYGLRAGEILGLRWRNVDLENGIFAVVEQLPYRLPPGATEVEEMAPVKSSERILPITESTRPYFERHCIQQEEQKCLMAAAGQSYYNNDLVIAKPNGIPERTQRISSEFGQLLRHLGMPHMRFHDTRHPNVKPKTQI